MYSVDMCADNNTYFSQLQATSVGIIKPGESFTYTDEVHIHVIIVWSIQI